MNKLFLGNLVLAISVGLASSASAQQTVSVRGYDPRYTDWQTVKNRADSETPIVSFQQDEEAKVQELGPPPPSDGDESSPSDLYGPRVQPSIPGPDARILPPDSGTHVHFSDLGFSGASTCGCGSFSSGCDAGSCGSCSQPWKLIQFNNSRVDVGGWISGGITLADHNVASTSPVAFPNPTDEFLFNQVWLYAERELQTNSCDWDWGFRVDALFGADGPDTQAFGDRGWDFGWNSGGTGGNTYGSAIPQAYVSMGRGDWSFKLGRFFTTIGNESVPVVNNFFYSHTYAMNYGEPFTHTGALAEYQAYENVKLVGGYTFGWDSGFDNFLDAHTFLGGTQVDVNDCFSFAYMVNVGNFGDGTAKGGVAGNAGDIFLQSLVATYQMTDRLRSISQMDAGTNQGAGSGDNEWYGFNQNFIYEVNRCWQTGLRYEVFRDHAGNSGRVTNNAETYQAWTAGVNWLPNRNIIVRPEVRWDYVGNNTQPFGGNNSLFTFGVDAIVRF